MELKKIAVGVDFSRESELAARQAIGLARHTGAEVVLVHVGPVPDFTPEPAHAPAALETYRDMVGEMLDNDRKELASLRERLAGQGVTVSTSVLDGFPDASLQQAAVELGADLLVVGTHGRTGLKRFLLGSVAEKVVRMSPQVLVARPGKSPPGSFKRILVPTDFSDTSDLAIQAALAVAPEGAEVDLLHAWQLPVYPTGYYMPSTVRDTVITPLATQLVADAQQKADALLAKYSGASATLQFQAVQGPAADTIIEHAAGYDLIVMGSHGRRGFRRMMLGSVAEVTVRHAPCSVLVTHAPE